MKKIAFVINVFRDGNFHSGGEKLFFNMVESFVNDGYLVDLHCCKYFYENDLSTKLNSITEYGNTKRFKNPKKIEEFINEVKKNIKDKDYNFIITDDITPPIDIVFAQGHSIAHRIKKTGFLDSILWSIKKHSHKMHQARWLKQDCRKFFVPSGVVKQDLIDNFNIDKDKISVIYPGIEDIEPQVKTFNKKLTLGISAPSFKYKGGYVFLKALSIVKKQGYEFNAKIIYPKANKSLLIKFLIHKYNLKNNVKFFDFQSSMKDFYTSIDWLCVPSYVETFALVALEAMKLRTPCIISSYVGAYEIINEEQNGLTFDMNKNKANNLAQKIIWTITNKDKYKTIQEKAKTTSDNFSWDNFYKTLKQEVN